MLTPRLLDFLLSLHALTLEECPDCEGACTDGEWDENSFGELVEGECETCDGLGSVVVDGTGSKVWP